MNLKNAISVNLFVKKTFQINQLTQNMVSNLQQRQVIQCFYPKMINKEKIIKHKEEHMDKIDVQQQMVIQYMSATFAILSLDMKTVYKSI